MTAIYFLNSGGEILEIMVPAWMGSGENLLLGCRLPPSCGEQNGEHALWCLLLEGANPSYEGAALRPSSNPNHLPKAPLFNDITLRGRVSIADFRGSKHSYLNRGRNDTWFLWGHSFIHSKTMSCVLPKAHMVYRRVSSGEQNKQKGKIIKDQFEC